MDTTAFIGKTESEARELCRQSNLRVFVISRNGVGVSLGEGMQLDRVQLVVEDDRVISATMG